MLTPSRPCSTAIPIALCAIAALGFAHVDNAGAVSLDAPLVQVAGSGGERSEDAKDRQPDAKSNIAPGQAARQARRKYGGRVLNVVLEDGPRGPYYRVKLLDGGRVRIVHVAARR